MYKTQKPVVLFSMKACTMMASLICEPEFKFNPQFVYSPQEQMLARMHITTIAVYFLLKMLKTSSALKSELVDENSQLLLLLLRLETGRRES